MLDSVNRQNFYEQLGRFSTTQLEDLTKQYPYQHELQLLLAKKYQLENNPAFDEQLQIAAIYAQDRELFYSLFNEHEVVNPGEPVNTYKFESVSEPAIINMEDTAVAEEILEVVSGPEPLVTAFGDEPVVETAADVVTNVTETPEEQVVSVVEPMLEETETVTAEEETFTDGEHTFEEWLKVFNKTKAVIEEVVAQAAEEPAEDELDRLIQENTPVNFLHELMEEETRQSKGLEEFIGEQIRKKKHKEVKKTADENEIDPSLATETLAKLYEMQRKYTRAIRTYEALTLKFPEKSDFFAARINYLKNLM